MNDGNLRKQLQMGLLIGHPAAYSEATGRTQSLMSLRCPHRLPAFERSLASASLCCSFFCCQRLKCCTSTVSTMPVLIPIRAPPVSRIIPAAAPITRIMRVIRRRTGSPMMRITVRFAGRSSRHRWWSLTVRPRSAVSFGGQLFRLLRRLSRSRTIGNSAADLPSADDPAAFATSFCGRRCARKFKLLHTAARPALTDSLRLLWGTLFLHDRHLLSEH